MSAGGPPQPEESNALISLSFDIAGSTAAKSEIVPLYREDENGITLAYSRLVRELYSHEAELYIELLKLGAPIADIFFVKSIGDEIWAVVSVRCSYPSLDFNKLAHAVLRAGLVTAARVVGYERPLTEQERLELDEGDERDRRTDSLPLKLYVDLLEHGAEVSGTRLDVFQAAFRKFIAAQPAPAQVSEETFTRLAGCAVVSAGYPKTTVASRFDFVGLEVDRFFRCTKFAEEGRLTIGKKLAESLLLEDSALPEEEDTPATVCLPIPLGSSGTSYERFTLTHERINKRELKGLRRGYSIYHVDHWAAPL